VKPFIWRSSFIQLYEQLIKNFEEESKFGGSRNPCPICPGECREAIIVRGGMVLNIVLAGIGGYGGQYVEALLKGGGKYPFTFIGAVDPYPENSPHLDLLKERQVAVYHTLEQFYAESHANLAIISSPIQFHCPQTCLALSHGSNVLCEKPLSATVAEALHMIEVRDHANRFVAVGYQWSYSKGMQALKRDITGGVFGKPKRLKTIVLWPRTDKYYSRSWAGKKQDISGNMILDSVANNATAHYIHNMFYVLGRQTNQSARPSLVTAELYRANNIENYDTAAMRTFTDEGVELLYYGSHAVNENVGALFRYEFEKADILFDDDDTAGKIIAHFHNGEKKEYDNPNMNREEKLWSAISAAHGDGQIVCGLEAALSQTICIHGMQESKCKITNFPEEIVRRGEPFWNNEEGNYVEGLVDQLKSCYEQAVLPAEAGFDWAKAGKEIQFG
jgi:predicted dehydrogenase